LELVDVSYRDKLTFYVWCRTSTTNVRRVSSALSAKVDTASVTLYYLETTLFLSLLHKPHQLKTVPKMCENFGSVNNWKHRTLVTADFWRGETCKGCQALQTVAFVSELLFRSSRCDTCKCLTDAAAPESKQRFTHVDRKGFKGNLLENLNLIFVMVRWYNERISCSRSVAYAENFHEGGPFSGIWWSFVFGVRCLWRHNL